MIIRINYKNNDFEEEIKEYLEHFITNILYDLSYKNVLSDLDEDDLDILEMKKDLATKWFEAYERANNILNPNIDIKQTKEDLSWLIDRIKTSLKQYLLNIPDLKNSKEFIENTFIFIILNPSFYNPSLLNYYCSTMQKPISNFSIFPLIIKA